MSAAVAAACLACAALAGACTVDFDASAPARVESARQELVGGTATSEDPGVVALSNGGDSAFCSGSLISPSVILTAAHCIDDAGNDPEFSAYFGPDYTGSGRRVGVNASGQHPSWSTVGSFDIGLVRVSVRQDPALVMPLNTVAIGAGDVDADYRHVGFGVSERNGDTLLDADGKKRSGTTQITGTESDVVVHANADVRVCFGDSGGPGLITRDDVEYVAGVHSTTTGQLCDPPNRDTRVDLYVDNFILPWIEDHDPACIADGLCARIGCQNDPDCQPCGPDGTCTSGCALPDPDCPTSAIGEVCQANSQCMTGTCIFWRDDPDYEFCTRECDPGNDDCPDGLSCQNRPGFGNVCYLDREPDGVLGDACAEDLDCGSYMCGSEGRCVKLCDAKRGLSCPIDFECVSPADDGNFVCESTKPLGSGGCRAGGEGTGGPLTLLLIAFAAVAGRRRQRLFG